MHIHGQKLGREMTSAARAGSRYLFAPLPRPPPSSQSMHVQASIAVENLRQPCRQPISSPTQHHASVAAAASALTCQWQTKKGKKISARRILTMLLQPAQASAAAAWPPLPFDKATNGNAPPIGCNSPHWSGDASPSVPISISISM